MAYTSCIHCNMITNLMSGEKTEGWVCPNCRMLKRIEHLETVVAALELKIVTQEKSA